MSGIKTGFAFIIALVVLLIVLPVFLWMAGISIFPGGSSGTSGSGKSGIVLRSADGGVRWDGVSFLQDGNIAAPAPAQVLHIAFDPTRPDTLYLGTKANGLWKSTDRGTTWKKMKDSSGSLLPTADVYRIAMSTSSPDVVYVAAFQNSKGRVFRSDNRGGSFREVYFVAPNNIPVYDIYVDPAQADRVVIATGQGGVLLSHNGGRTWSVAHWFSETMVRIAGNPAFFSDTYAVGSNRQLKKTLDEGENWAELGSAHGGEGGFTPGSVGGFGATPEPIQGFPRSPLYFGPISGSSGSLFGGNQQVGLETFAIDPANFERIFIGAVEGLYRSLDGGFAWSRIETLVYPSAITVTAIVVHPRNRGTIFTGIGTELYRTDDDGKTWSVRVLPTNQSIRSIAIHPTQPDIMLISVGKK